MSSIIFIAFSNFLSPPASVLWRGKVMGYGDTADLTLYPFPEQLYLHPDEPSQFLFGADFLENIWHCLKMQMFMQIYLAAYSLKILFHQQNLCP